MSRDELKKEQARDSRGARFDKDWTKGSILGNLWGLSWPMIVTQAVTTLGPTFDMIWVGKLGAAAIAGVGIAGMVVQVAGSARMGLQTGTRAIVARFVGAGDEQGANHVAQQYFLISIAFGIVMAALGFLSRQMLLLLGLEADVVDQGAAYLRIQLFGMVTMSFQMMSQSLMQASGDAKTPMKISIWTRLLHVGLAPILIFGWWLFPRMGVSGAALTNVGSQGVAGAGGRWFGGAKEQAAVCLLLAEHHPIAAGFSLPRVSETPALGPATSRPPWHRRLARTAPRPRCPAAPPLRAAGRAAFPRENPP